MNACAQAARQNRDSEFKGYFSVTTTPNTKQACILHVSSAHVPCRSAPCHEITKKPGGGSMRDETSEIYVRIDPI